MNVKDELHKAVASNQRASVRLYDGEVIIGMIEVSTDLERVKIRTDVGPMWVPYTDIEHVSRVINMFH